MSQIAQALAKAKERTGHTTAPFLSAGPAPAPGASPVAAPDSKTRKARNTQRFWLFVAIFSLPLTAFVLWVRLKPTFASAQAPEPATASAPLTAGIGATVSSPRPIPGASTATTLPPANVAPAIGSANARSEIASLVARLPISAVLPGDPARIMVDGRVVRAGEAAQGELIFLGMENHELRFRDARGAIYTRRY